jgi:C-terminal processing protease CtpA/Prc
MKNCAILALLFACSLRAFSQSTPPQASPRSTIQQSLGFEQQSDGPAPTGWSVGPAGSVFADSQTVHSGKWAARLECSASTTGHASVLTRSIPVDFSGDTLELRGFLRLKDVTGFAGFWMREDGDSGDVLQFDNMQSRGIKGTLGWAEYSIKLPIKLASGKLFFGALIAGSGTLWVDDLQLLVDGKPIAEAPAALAPPNSKIHIDALTPAQIDNLATLARVWGFLKYHHPAVTSGTRQWDDDLFRILPAVLAAPDRPHANNVLLTWIDSLGPVPACKPCAQLSLNGLDVKPDIDWIHDQLRLGPPLVERLEQIYANRPVKDQYYVATTLIGNPRFAHEPSYPGLGFPDSGFQLLALFRWWNILQYWAPDRVVAAQDWPAVLTEFIPKLALAKDKDAYTLALIELIGKANDTHAGLASGGALLPPTGACMLPVSLRLIDGIPVVDAFTVKDTAQTAAFHLGDALESLDGASMSSLIDSWVPFYGASNQAARLRRMAILLTRGACGPTQVQVRRDGRPLQVTATRLPVKGMEIFRWHDLPGDTFRLLSPDIAYLKLSTVKAADVPGYIDRARKTKGLIVDIRNYPSDFMPFVLGSLLVSGKTPFATFSNADLANPGAFRFATTNSIDPGQPHYSGRVVILVDETSVSQAEYTAMALRAAPNAIVVGSTTSGADGNVSSIPLPGDLETHISGLGVFYPDHRPTQRIGIVPDVVSRPTAAGIAAGRDEVLETAIRQILGPAVSRPEIERLAKPAAPSPTPTN